MSSLFKTIQSAQANTGPKTSTELNSGVSIKDGRLYIDTNSEIMSIMGNILANYYNNDNYRNAVGSKILPTDAYVNEGLYMLHYVNNLTNEEMGLYGDIRGVIVDINNKIVVADSFGSLEVVESNTMPIANDENMYELTDVRGNKHIINANTARFRYGVEGTLVRYIYYKNMVIMATHRRFNANAETSTLPGIQGYTFAQLGWALGMPTHNELYDYTKSTSPWIYSFMICFDPLSSYTRESYGKGIISFMGVKKSIPVYEIFKNTDMFDDVQHSNVLSNFTDVMCDINIEPCKYIPKVLVSDEVNLRLKRGNVINKLPNIDNRLSTGESVLLEYTNGDSVFMLRIAPTSYVWRMKIRGYNMTITEQFFNMFDFNKYNIRFDNNGNIISININKFKEDYIIFKYSSYDDLVNIYNTNNGINYYALNKSKKPITSYYDVVYQFIMNLLMAMPVLYQPYLLDIYAKHNTFLMQLSEQIYNMYGLPNESRMSQVKNDTIYKIIYLYILPTTVKEFGERINIMNIKSTLMQTNGNTLYKLLNWLYKDSIDNSFTAANFDINQ